MIDKDKERQWRDNDLLEDGVDDYICPTPKESGAIED